MVTLDELDQTKERKSVVKWLKIKHANLEGNTRFAYVNMIRNRLDSEAINSFVINSSLSKKQVSRLLHVSERTLQRNIPEKKLGVDISEKLIELARLFYKGIDVFQSKEKFLFWLNRPSRPLNNMKPIELIETNIGVDLVLDELYRIEYGVFS